MSFWSALVPDDQHLVRYLLGLLPEEETESLDELGIVDDEVAARLQCVEDELVDAYVSGTLDVDLRERFERCYLASPVRRDKVKFAKRLLDAVDRAPHAASAAPRSTPSCAEEGRRPARFESHERVRVRSRRAWLPGAAAVLAVACGVLLVEEGRLRHDLADAQHISVVLDQRARALAGQLDRQQAANDVLARDLERARSTQTSPAIALVLMPQTRAAGPVSAIAVPPGVSAVLFDLQLETGSFPRYDVALRDLATNRIVWRSGALTHDASPRPSTLSVRVPGGLLKPQHYLFEVSGYTAGGLSEIIGGYPFEIAPR